MKTKEKTPKVKNPEAVGIKGHAGATLLESTNSVASSLMSTVFMLYLTDYAGIGQWGAVLGTVLLLVARLFDTPDYYHFLLTGKKVNEYTIASTGALVNAETKQWEMSLISRLQLPKKLFGELEMPGTMIGHLRDEVQQVVGFDAAVVLPASHDTASAFLAIPALDDHAVYLSSGTWSLLGVENDHPITTTESLEKNFSNEGGAWGRYHD